MSSKRTKELTEKEKKIAGQGEEGGRRAAGSAGGREGERGGRRSSQGQGEKQLVRCGHPCPGLQGTLPGELGTHVGIFHSRPTDPWLGSCSQANQVSSNWEQLGLRGFCNIYCFQTLLPVASVFSY